MENNANPIRIETCSGQNSTSEHDKLQKYDNLPTYMLEDILTFVDLSKFSKVQKGFDINFTALPNDKTAWVLNHPTKFEFIKQYLKLVLSRSCDNCDKQNQVPHKFTQLPNHTLVNTRYLWIFWLYFWGLIAHDPFTSAS